MMAAVFAPPVNSNVMLPQPNATSMEYDWTHWSDWNTLGLCYGLDLAVVPSKPGSYIIAADRPLTRCVGTDPHGILTIGESEDLRRRIQVFCSCAITRGSEGHSAGWRYAFLRLDRFFPFASLRFRWRVTESKQHAQELEGEMLVRYLAHHVELPPLNYASNQHAFNKHGWDLFDKLVDAESKTPAT